MSKAPHRYPVGVQGFDEIWTDNYVYVDKTRSVWDMTHSGGGGAVRSPGRVACRRIRCPSPQRNRRFRATSGISAGHTRVLRTAQVVGAPAALCLSYRDHQVQPAIGLLGAQQPQEREHASRFRRSLRNHRGGASRADGCRRRMAGKRAGHDDAGGLLPSEGALRRVSLLEGFSRCVQPVRPHACVGRLRDRLMVLLHGNPQLARADAWALPGRSPVP